MKSLNKTASLTFAKLITQMGQADYLKLDRGGSAIMALSIEKLVPEVDFAGTNATIYSLSHYFEQNGDLVPDPDMTFAVINPKDQQPALAGKTPCHPDGRRPEGPHHHQLHSKHLLIIPLTFQNSIYYTEAIFLKANSWQIHPKQQADLADFANNWLKNIQWQQDL
jgi:hypothetical protein